MRQHVQELEQERQRDAVDGQSALDALNHEIAALTAKLAAVEEERDQWREIFERGCNDNKYLNNKYLKQQLATAQAKIIALTDALESGFMKGAYARLYELQHKEQRLYAAEARIRELEQALRLHLAVAKDDPILLTPIEVQLVKSLARIQELEAR